MDIYDVFISYAHEDEEIAKSLADMLSKLGLEVWIDELKLKIGDSISQKIGEAIKKSKYGVVVLSRYYLKKKWPIEELKLLFNLQLSTGQKMILPMWHGIDKKEIEDTFPFLIDIKALSTEKYSLSTIAKEIYNVVNSITQSDFKKEIKLVIDNTSVSFEARSDKNLTRTLKIANLKSTLRRSLLSAKFD